MNLLCVPLSDVFTTNGYFYVDEDTGHGFLIDPAAESEKLLSIISSRGWTIERMLLTHGHFDHTGAVSSLHERLGIPYSIHKNGAQYLLNTQWNLSAFCERHVILRDAEYLEDGADIALSGSDALHLRMLHTPGHTTDSAVYYDEAHNVAFVGDTIFRGAVGTTQYPGGNEAELRQSILGVIFRMSDDTRLYSGHSEPTTVGAEKARMMIC